MPGKTHSDNHFLKKGMKRHQQEVCAQTTAISNRKHYIKKP